MQKRFLPLLLVMPLLVSASIVETNSGLDRANVGSWSFFTGANTDVTASTRDNILLNGDTWLAQNAGHFVKSPYGAEDGAKVDEGFAGIYKGAGGDVVYMLYTFTAASAITEQEWIAKGTVWRFASEANSGRLQFAVNPRGEGFTVVDFTEWFGRSVDGADIDMGAVAAGTAFDGPTASYTTDLSALNIQSGNSVVYRFTLNADALAGTTSRRVGIGVQLVPEPNTVLMALGGTFLLYVMYRRKT